MQTPSEPLPPLESDTSHKAQIPALEPYVAQLVLAKAAELARSGNYQEAEELLSGLQEGKEQPAVLDLQARMCAQQGRWLEAEAFWKQALQHDPTNPVFLEGLQYVQRAQRPPTLKRFLSPVLLLWIIVLLVLLLAVSGIKRLVSLEKEIGGISGEVSSLKDVLNQPQEAIVLPTQVMPTFPVADLADLRQEVQETSRLNQAALEGLQSQVVEIQTSQTDLLDRLQATPTAVQAINLDVPGLQLLAQEQGWSILFEEGLFPYGWALSQAARQTLDGLSQQLKPYVNKIEVGIVGFKSSDEQDEYFDLGLMRAVVVLEYLQSSGQLPSDLFKIQPQGSLPPPFSNDTVADRGRNRTVILIIRLKTP